MPIDINSESAILNIDHKKLTVADMSKKNVYRLFMSQCLRSGKNMAECVKLYQEFKNGN